MPSTFSWVDFSDEGNRRYQIFILNSSLNHLLTIKNFSPRIFNVQRYYSLRK